MSGPDNDAEEYVVFTKHHRKRKSPSSACVCVLISEEKDAKMPIAAVNASQMCCPPVEKDVEFIVKKISETLHLKACQKQLYYGCRNRPTPYSVVSSDERLHAKRHGHLARKPHQRHRYRRNPSYSSGRNSSGDSDTSPYDLLQDLLREGTLVREAVRRLESRVESARLSSSERDSSCADRHMPCKHVACETTSDNETSNSEDDSCFYDEETELCDRNVPLDL